MWRDITKGNRKPRVLQAGKVKNLRTIFKTI